ncbi:hypothetical protein OJ996_03700 [Luteolibacter sp. GHJ8]|uniref:Nucleotidyltransferase AbiEii toxin of type IV toxin-antitoxin system n=2 Tax=Luteolibacter rhizosphaerae TaxID=2989719 RepID=A0ABT3FYJ6_9BACT|nr:hypothetical protein [Luteolibacter rhizosphaerae]
MRSLGKRTWGAGTIYLTGGATALLHGWRPSTIDIDLKADPEPSGWFEALAFLKDDLSVNVELASPDQFIPALPGWRERSPFIVRHGSLDFHHYDLYSQALAKLERGHTRDVVDVTAMRESGLINSDRLLDLFLRIEPDLIRYPSLDPRSFRASVTRFVEAS